MDTSKLNFENVKSIYQGMATGTEIIRSVIGRLVVIEYHDDKLETFEMKDHYAAHNAVDILSKKRLGLE